MSVNFAELRRLQSERLKATRALAHNPGDAGAKENYNQSTAHWAAAMTRAGSDLLRSIDTLVLANERLLAENAELRRLLNGKAEA